MSDEQTCPCGDDRCLHFSGGYPWCRPCGEHHRPPECAINTAGQSLGPCGCPWEELDAEPYCRHARAADEEEEAAEQPRVRVTLHTDGAEIPVFLHPSMNTNMGTYATGQTFNVRWTGRH